MGQLTQFWADSHSFDVGGRVLQLGRLINGDGADDLYVGDEFVDQFLGFGGNDTLSGAANSDTMYGMVGDDDLIGGSGDDFLYGDVGGDALSGGSARTR